MMIHYKPIFIHNEFISYSILDELVQLPFLMSRPSFNIIMKIQKTRQMICKEICVLAVLANLAKFSHM